MTTERLLDGPFSKGLKTFELLAMDRRFTSELGEAIRGKDGVRRALDALTREFFPAKAAVVPIPKTKAKAFPTWRRIKIGTHKSVEELVAAIEAKGLKISNWARETSKNVALAKEVTEVELVVASVAKLGFLKGATRKDIYDRAISLGLSLCPLEVGMQLRLQYEDQPKGEWLLVAMEPIKDFDRGLNVFRVVNCGDGSWLDTNAGRGDHDYVWNAGRRWVFLRSKSKQS